jgi:predicted Zn-dependent protease
MRTPDSTGSGDAWFTLPRMAEIDAPAPAAHAAATAESSAHPRDLLPGRYPVILKPALVADLQMMLVSSKNVRSVDEGRSFRSRPGGGWPGSSSPTA